MKKEISWIPTASLLCLLKYFVEEKHLTGEVAKSFSVSQLIDQLCKKLGVKLNETPVGFKYLCQLMIERDILIAGEESGGLGVKGHLPERDGIYIGLILCEILAVRRKKLSELVEELMNEFGWHYYNRYDAHLTEKEKQRILKAYKKGVKEIAGCSGASRGNERRFQALYGKRLGACPRIRD